MSRRGSHLSCRCRLPDSEPPARVTPDALHPAERCAAFGALPRPNTRCSSPHSACHWILLFTHQDGDGCAPDHWKADGESPCDMGCGSSLCSMVVGVGIACCIRGRDRASLQKGSVWRGGREVFPLAQDLIREYPYRRRSVRAAPEGPTTHRTSDTAVARKHLKLLRRMTYSFRERRERRQAPSTGRRGRRSPGVVERASASWVGDGSNALPSPP